MIRRPIVVWIAMISSALALSGCYTLLQSPGFATRDTAPDDVYTWDAGGSDVSPLVGDFDAESQYPYGYGPSRSAGVPVFGYDSLYGLYGFGSPYAYGPFGGLYSGGYGYGSNAGPYGYGYDPYYSGSRGSRGSYIPPGYQLITTQALDTLVRNQGQGVGTTSPISDAERATQLRRQQREADRAWTQRTGPERRSTQTVRTTRPEESSGRVTTSSSSSTTSSSSESSGSSAAKRRKKKR